MQGADCIIEMDADFSHDPRYIPLFLQAISDSDVVIGSRWMEGGKVLGRSWQRNYLSILSQLFCRFVLGLNISDATSGFRCFKRNTLQQLELDKFLSTGPSIVEEVNFHLRKKKFKIKEVPIAFMPRRNGCTKLNLSKVCNTFWTLMKVKLRGRL
jgi:dolichol-phosphate mannosyltransferase